MMIMITLFLIIFSILLIISRLIHKLWLKPLQIQKFLRSQGIKGPSYKFIHGNTKEIIKMRREAFSSCDELCSHDVFPRVLPHFNAWIKLYGNNFLMWIGDRPQIIVTEPELAREILTNKEGVYKKIKTSDFGKRLLGDGLVVADGEKWSKLRKLSNYAFHGDSLKDMVPAMVECVETMMERLGENLGEEIEISKEFKLVSSDIIAKTAFGSSYVEGQDIFNMLTKLVVLVTRNTFKIKPFRLKWIWRSSDEIEADKVEQSLRDSIVSLVRKREEMVRRGELENFGNDYLGGLMKANHEVDPKIRISLDDIIDECKVFFVAGNETTSGLLSWTTLLLSIHDEWQERARDEVVRLFGMEKPTAVGLSRLKILTMILNEALRLYTPAISLTRKASRETRLGSYKIPANVEVNVPLLALHRKVEIWGKDAHLFKPERFVDGVAKAGNKGSSTAFLPFGGGPRVCVGLNFAGHEARVALVMILQRYKFTLSPNYIHAPFQLLTVNPQHGIQIILQSL